jgi:hypothetical protein
MPPPLPDGMGTTKVASQVSWSLFAKGAPAVDDVRQGGLADCPLAALLAALAFTPSGRKHLLGVVTEHGGIVETDLSAVASQLDDPPPGNKITSNRYFSVTLGGKTFEVSDVLYTDESTDPIPIYMKSLNRLLWPGVIEKAYAEKEGGYAALEGLTANVVWETVVGSKAGGFPVTAQTEKAQIEGAAKNATKIPTMAASADAAAAVTDWHGFAVLGMQGAKILLYDPAKVRRETVSLEDFRKNFKAVLHGH